MVRLCIFASDFLIWGGCRSARQVKIEKQLVSKKNLRAILWLKDNALCLGRAASFPTEEADSKDRAERGNSNHYPNRQQDASRADT